MKIQKLHPDAIIPEYKTTGAAGFDFTLIEDVEISPRSTKLVKLGLAVEVPEGYFLAIISRGSGPLKSGTTMANGVGVVDSDYRGPQDELMCLVENITDTPLTLTKGQRVAQGLILPVIQVTFVESELDGLNRGGHGSTGGHGVRT